MGTEQVESFQWQCVTRMSLWRQRGFFFEVRDQFFFNFASNA